MNREKLEEVLKEMLGDYRHHIYQLALCSNKGEWVIADAHEDRAEKAKQALIDFILENGNG